MKFYKVTWDDEAAPEGTAGDYFTRKREAQKVANSINREQQKTIREAQKRAKAEVEAGSADPDYWYNQVPNCRETEVETLEFTGTVKQMMLWALKNQINPY